jgi:hypothetical protein
MTTTTLTLTPRTLIAAGTSNTAGSTTRGVQDMRTRQGGVLTIKLTNGGTGPTLQATASVLIAHDAGATPAAGSAGAVWKTLYPPVGNGTTASTIGEWSYPVPPCCHLEVEVTGNTGQTVTCEAFLTEYTDAQTA